MKNPLTPAWIEPATFRFVAQHLKHCATAVPFQAYRFTNSISLAPICTTSSHTCTDSLHFLDSVRGCSGYCRVAKDRIFNSPLFGPFLKSRLSQLAFWWLVFVCTDNGRDNCLGFTPTVSFHTLPVVWSSCNSKFLKINPRYADAVK